MLDRCPGHRSVGGPRRLAVLLVAVCHLAVAQAQAGEPTRGPGTAAPGAQPSAAAETRKSHAGNLVGHGGPIKAIAVDPDSSRALTGSFDYAMMAWDLSGTEPRLLNRLAEHDGAVNAVAFLPGARRALAAGDDGRIALWDLETGKLLARLEGHTAKIIALAVSPDGRLAASASWDRTARLWDLEHLSAGPVIAGHQGPVNAVAFSADGQRLYTAGYDGAVNLYAVGDGSLVRLVHKHGWGVNVLARLPGGERLVLGALNGSAKVIDGETGRVVAELPDCERPILSLAQVEKPGLVALGSGDGLVRVVRIGDWSVIEEHANPYGPVWALAFAPGATAMYYGGLDDFATRWQIAPREAFEQVDSTYPRRFQQSASGDNPLAEGELQFARKCSVCHTLEPDGRNRAGPTLSGIFGRRIASVPGYPYSEALRGLDFVWTPEMVERLFELGPEVVTPGSKMPLQRMTEAGQRAALIAYLKAATAAAVPGSPADATQGESK
ncbi:MAG: c-type cytochrome [Pseudomonadota bacterium]